MLHSRGFFVVSVSVVPRSEIRVPNVPGAGIEPTFPRSERGVLPLNVPRSVVEPGTGRRSRTFMCPGSKPSGLPLAHPRIRAAAVAGIEPA